MGSHKFLRYENNCGFGDRPLDLGQRHSDQ
jgi:hypothetical protein